MSVLQGELAEAIALALLDADITLPVELTRVERIPGPDPWDPPVQTTVTHPCLGWPDQFSDMTRASTLIQASDVRVMVLAVTLDVEPRPGDRVTVRGETYHVISVASDPALCCWELQARA